MGSSHGPLSRPARTAAAASKTQLLTPLVRAYALGYASSTVPRLLTLCLTHLRVHKDRLGVDARNQTDAGPGPTEGVGVSAKPSAPRPDFVSALLRVLRGGLELQRFPTFCAALVGSATLLEIPIGKLLRRLAAKLSKSAQLSLTRYLSSFIGAWLSLKLLQSKESEDFIDRVPPNTYGPTGLPLKSTHYAGRTIDLTLFALARAADVLVGSLWSSHKIRRLQAGRWSRAERFLSHMTDPAVFSASCAVIMWCWIYEPTKLPRSYNAWIRSAAAVDNRLLLALRGVRDRSITYGVDTGQEHILQGMCTDYKWPLAWSDPTVSIPFPCEMVHHGIGPSCELHATSRLYRSFLWALTTYLPLNLAMVALRPSRRALVRAVGAALRSSAFLGTFIALYYYGICLARTRLGPHLLGSSPAAHQALDGGHCVGTGCALCGWSVLLEKPSRRTELSLFVTPRALAACLPRRYALRHQWRENAVFALSTAVVFTCVRERPERVRGVLGKLLGGVLAR